MALLTETFPETAAAINQKVDVQAVPVGQEINWWSALDSNRVGQLLAVERAIRLNAVIAAIAPATAGINGKAFKFDSIDATSGLGRASVSLSADLDKRFAAAIEKIEQGGDLDGTASAIGFMGVYAGNISMVSNTFVTGTLLGLSAGGGIITYVAGKFGPIGKAIDATTAYVDLSVLRNPADAASIQYDASGELAVIEAGIDHGGLGGLGDDDHTIYILADGTRAWSGDLNHDGANIGFFGTTPADIGGATEDIKDWLITIFGGLAGATPLDLDGGAMTCGALSSSDDYTIANGKIIKTNNASGSLEVRSSNTLTNRSSVRLSVAQGILRYDVTSRVEWNATGVGFFAKAPVAQPAHIIDADGTLADITTKFNTLLTALDAGSGLGLLAS